MGARILVIEDDKDLCEEIRVVLDGEGFGAEFAHSGDRGLEMVTNGDFDLVILDLKLPGRSGVKILRDLSTQDLAPPVLVMTGRPMAGELETGVADEIAGLADGVITKPFSVPGLLSSIRSLLP